MRRLRRWHRSCETVSTGPTSSTRSAASPPAAPARHPRNRGQQRQRSFPALPSGRVMLSANVSGNANAHHQVQHRARHGLRERCGFATSTLRSCCAPTALHLLLQVRAVPLAPRCSRNLLGSQVPRQRPVRNAAMRRVHLLVPCRRERRPRQSCRPRDEARGLSLCSRRRKRRVSRAAASLVSRKARLPSSSTRSPQALFSSRTHGPTGFAATCHAVARSATAETPRPAGPSILVTPWA